MIFIDIQYEQRVQITENQSAFSNDVDFEFPSSQRGRGLMKFLHVAVLRKKSEASEKEILYGYVQNQKQKNKDIYTN